ncbi:hypothetical protein LguiA_027634 [Lonicera macranthoides]
MTKDQPMTASERQRRRVKHAVVSGVKQYGKRKNPTPSAPESESVAAPPPAPANPETEIATEGEDRSGASKEDDDGGPIDKSVLISFKDHIVYAIWNREEDADRKLATIFHWPKLNEWKLSEEVEGVQSRVRASGLIHLVDNTYRYIDYVAIQAFVERWQPETNTFHLPFGEMTITLDDVRQILGVPVEGDCLTSPEGAKEIQPKVAIDMASKLLGMTEAEVVEETKDTYAIRLQLLKERCMGRATAESTPEELDICARAYIMFLLGCVVFPDKTKTKISIYFLGCLRDISKVGNLGWGMAILAHTYRQLGHASRSGVRSISGCLTLIVAWICEHFPDCVRIVPNIEYVEAEPRMCRWKPQQLGGDTAATLISLREKLDDFSAIDEVMAEKAISLLDRAIEGAEGGNISIVVARSVRDMLSSAIVESGQEERRKKRHEASTAPSASTSPPTTAQRALSASSRPPRPPVANTRTQATKGKAPAKKKSKN